MWIWSMPTHCIKLCLGQKVYSQWISLHVPYNPFSQQRERKVNCLKAKVFVDGAQRDRLLHISISVVLLLEEEYMQFGATHVIWCVKCEPPHLSQVVMHRIRNKNLSRRNIRTHHETNVMNLIFQTISSYIAFV